MTSYEPTSLARGPLLLLRYAEQIGLDQQQLMARAGLSAEMLQDPDARIRHSYMMELWRVVREGRENEPHGLRAAQTLHASELGVVGYAMIYSESLLRALHRLVRYSRLLSEAVQYQVQERDDRIVLVAEAHSNLLAMWHPVVTSLAVTLTVLREITGEPVAPLEVRLQPPSPAETDEYREFFGCPVRFDKARAAIVFSRSQMQLPIKAADPVLSGYLDQLAGHVLGSLQAPPESFVDQVRRALWYELSAGKPEVWRIAKRLKTSPRTLQRRLTQSGTSFSALLEQLRRDLSGRLLLDRKLAVSEVAFLLGYSEPSAFQRAFRRWQGQSPSQFRAA